MTKQKKIKEGIAGILFNNGVSNRGHIVRQIQEFEDSQGVVVKVERELPECPSKMTTDKVNQSYPKGIPKGYHILREAGQAEGFIASQAIMLASGYVAVEPLMEEK